MSSGAVSVVIPAYNAAGTIAEALDSVWEQTRRPEEVIVVDDASTDETAQVVGQWRAQRSAGDKVRLIRLGRNSGPAVARNRGIAEACGDWVAFLDGDDQWLPRRLEWQLRLAAKQPEVVVWCGRVELMAETGESACWGKTGTEGVERLQTDEEASVRFWAIRLRDLVLANRVSTSTVLVRASALRAAGGFDTRFRGPEDFDLWLRLAARHPVMFVDLPLARYRQRPGSLSLDDRAFLPQVLGVLHKAFGKGGGLQDHPDLRRKAIGLQYFSASWMAFSRGARGRAIWFFLKGWWLAPGAVPKESEMGDAWLRWRLLARYLVGRPERSVNAVTQGGAERAAGT